MHYSMGDSLRNVGEGDDVFETATEDLHPFFVSQSQSAIYASLQSFPDGKVERLYGLAPAGKFYVQDGKLGSFAPLITFQCEKDVMEIYYHCKDVVLGSDSAWNGAHKEWISNYMKTNPRLSSKFNNAMTQMATITMNKILEKYNGFEGLRSLVDIGGGNGTTLNLIISKYPSLMGINFDMPHVTKLAPSYPGIEHVGGDMFESIPKGDAVLLKCILHNWSDERCLKLLTNCYKVLSENGKLIIIESVLPIAPNADDKTVSLMDNLMVAVYEGKERTEEEFMTLCKDAGFSQVHFVCCACSYWVIEVYK